MRVSRVMKVWGIGIGKCIKCLNTSCVLYVGRGGFSFEDRTVLQICSIYLSLDLSGYIVYS